MTMRDQLHTVTAVFTAMWLNTSTSPNCCLVTIIVVYTQLDGERRRLAQQVELKALTLVDRQASVRAQVL